MCALADHQYIALITFSVWWLSVFASLIAYRYRKVWNVGTMPWTFLTLGFLSFGIREFLDLFTYPLFEAGKSLFGIWAAVFLLAAFLYLYRTLYQRKAPPVEMKYAPFAVNLAAFILLLGWYEAGNAIASIDSAMALLEGVVWILQGIAMVYITYMLGTCSTGGFIKIYFLAQLSAYSAVMWKLMALLGVDHIQREFAEMLFIVFAGLSVYSLAVMLRRLSRHIG